MGQQLFSRGIVSFFKMPTEYKESVNLHLSIGVTLVISIIIEFIRTH
jgi:hypothetical protein